MPFAAAKILDHGTTNPIVARLLLQTTDIMQSCNTTRDVQDEILGLCMKSLAPGLLRCWDIRERYEAEFQWQIEAYKNQLPHAQMIQAPWITTLDQDCRNFLYEAKNFLRDLMQLFNLLYGTKFEDASDYLPPKGKKPKTFVLSFAEQTFGPTDPRTIFLKKLAPDVDRIITYRNSVEHPKGRLGPLEIRNFELKDGKLIEPCWWRPKARDPNKPVKYVVDATDELLRLITEHAKQEAGNCN